MTKRRILAGLVLLILVGAAALYWTFVAAPEVTVAQPVRGPAVKAVYATGNVEATYWAKVTPLVKGRIEEICACEGKKVSRGDILAKLDDKETQAELNALKAREAFAADELERYSRLLERKVVSSQAYQKVAAERSELLASIAAAYERLAQRILRAPMDGIVLRRDGEVGEVAQPTDILFWVGQPRPLRITAEVDEEDIPLVKIGQRALIKADAFPGQALAGGVDQITPKGDPTNKNYRVRIGLPDDTPLLIGMTTEINIVVKEVADALLVPTNAVRDGAVWVVADGRVTRRPVKLGIAGDARTQVLSGLKPDEAVVQDPPPGLRDGGRVKVARGPAT